MKPYTSKIAASSVTVGTALWDGTLGTLYVWTTRQEWIKSQYVGSWINGSWHEAGAFVDVVVGASTK